MFFYHILEVLLIRIRIHGAALVLYARSPRPYWLVKYANMASFWKYFLFWRMSDECLKYYPIFRIYLLIRGLFIFA